MKNADPANLSISATQSGEKAPAESPQEICLSHALQSVYGDILLIDFEKEALPGFPWVADLLMSFPEGTNEGYGPIFSDSRADRALVC